MDKISSQSQLPSLIGALRQLLRARGLRHSDIAQRLGVAERTVTRWLSGERIDAQTIEQLCSLTGLSLFEVCDFASQRHEQHNNQLTMKQEAVLAEESVISYFFFGLLKGWTPKELQEDADIPEAVTVKVLVRLDKAGLIELLPGNEIRLRIARKIVPRNGGPISHAMNKWLRQTFRDININDKRSVIQYQELKLSAGSMAQIAKKFESLLEEIRGIAATDRPNHNNRKHWHTVLLAAQHHEIGPYANWPEP